MNRSVGTQFSRNLVVNLLFTASNMIIGIFLVPYFIDTLGIAGYGIIPLATSLASYMTLVTNSISSTVARYLTMEVNDGDMVAANRTYNTSYYGTLNIVLAIIPLALVVSVLSPYIFDITGNSAIDVQILFATILVSLLITIWCNNFSTVYFANNRLDYRNAIKLFQLLLQTGLIVVFFNVWGPNLVLIGAAYLIASLAYAAVSYYFCRKVCPELRCRRSEYDTGYFSEIGKVCVWNILNSAGRLLFIQASLIIANIFLGSALGGEFSIIVTLISAVLGLYDTVSSVTTPITYMSYSEESSDAIVGFTALAMRLTGLMMALPLAFLSAFSVDVLTVWVGSEFSGLSTLVWITCGAMCLVGVARCLETLPIAFLKVRAPAIVTLLFGAMNIVIGIAVCTIFDLGNKGLAIAWGITMVLNSCVYLPIYCGRIAKTSSAIFFRRLGQSFLVYVVLSAILYVLHRTVHFDQTLFSLIAIALVLMVIYLPIILRLGFSKDERATIRNCLPGKLADLLPGWIL